MKLLVCCVLLIANISDNSKASLESYTPTSTNILFEDITRNADKSCNRPCKFNVKPRRCHYNFTVEPIVGDNDKIAISVNGITPGPPINVCVNDVIVVEVKNKIPDQDLTIHWHGVNQMGTPHMDGVPMVTQCPIAYGTSYKYAFIASSPGTFFYHADSVSHQSDGVYGSLIVNQPQPQEAHAALYDYDRSDEGTLLIAAQFPTLLSAYLEDVAHIQPDALTVNGDDENFKVFVLQGYAYRLRLINAIAIECPVIIQIEQHEMVVIATDGKPVKPLPARTVKLYPGERMDVVVRASQESGGYWIKVNAGGACAGVSANAMLLYSGFNYTSMLQQGVNEVDHENGLDSDSAVYGQMLESLQEVSQDAPPEPVYLGINRKKWNIKEKDIDFRYISDAIPKKVYYPASFGLKSSGVVQINGKSFLYPNTPMLLYPQDVKGDFICKVGEESENPEPQCVMVLEPKENVLELVLVNEGFESNESYTFHMHGYTMQVVSSGRHPQGKPMSKEEFEKLNQGGAVFRNLKHAPLKDTIVVPKKGYAVVRIKPDHGGSWLLECRSCGLSSLPAAIIINVPQKMPKSVVRSLAKCGNYRPPDVLLN
ncbi:unnamed protein product [Chilo suppressalis]|uniref:Uncharacterized protein n=1 Tax=Chilo suppressalis TaxID=168631 RepID=A0ABN8BFX4_CHISP|nr:unnamed protein product [Chilo suppressalis]